MKAETIRRTVEKWEREPETARGKPPVTGLSEGATAALEAVATNFRRAAS